MCNYKNTNINQKQNDIDDFIFLICVFIITHVLYIYVCID